MISIVTAKSAIFVLTHVFLISAHNDPINSTITAIIARTVRGYKYHGIRANND